VHFIGIGGSGLSAIARLLNESGYQVTGSDKNLSPAAADLQDAGVAVYVGHHPRNVSGADWVVRSSAVTDDNVEVQAARNAGIPVYKRVDILGQLMTGKIGIAIAGTHGKTTTTAMTAWALSELGLDPSFIIGGVAANFGVNAHAGNGAHFVAEADEYDYMFLGLLPRVEVITNLEHDHPDCFPTFADMRRAFERFVDRLPADGTLIGCVEDDGSRGLLTYAAGRGRPVIAYGEGASTSGHGPQWLEARAISRNQNGGFSFTAASDAASPQPVQVDLRVPGQHNVLNALAVLGVLRVLGLSLEAGSHALRTFAGTSRRFEVRGERNGVTVIDDYAHHPTEIRATLAAARARYPGRRIWAIWQPHTYSRTRLLAGEFAAAFSDADEALVTEIFASREAPQDFSSEDVVRLMRHPSARYSGSLDATVAHLQERLAPGDVLLVLSAGDADQISERILHGS